jgi:hypothetical protein
MEFAVLESGSKNLMKLQCQRFAAALLALLSFQVSATPRYVDLNSTNPVSPYTSWATAATNIQDAVSHAFFGDTILVTNGIYQSGSYSSSGNNRVFIYNNLTVQSVNGPAVTTIMGYQVPGTTNGSSAVRCVYLNDGSTLSGFTLTNGATQISGTPYGGGVYCQSTGALVTNCVITGNAAGNSGGGVYSGSLVNCVITGNSSQIGGGVYYSGLTNCTLIGNSAVSLGWGGGAYYGTLVNCLVSGNHAGYRGGAAYGGSLINCTIVGNVGQPTSIEYCKLTNCISYYNSPDNASAGQGNNYFNNCCTIPLPNTGINTITNPPAFVNLSAGDFHLNAASPCINAGNNSYIANSTDLDGNPRIVNGTVDLGAYEFQSPVRFVSVSNPAPVSPFTNWLTAATNIQDAIDVANAGDFIVVSNGTYNTGGRAVYGVATNRVVVDKAVTVQSVNGAASTIIQGVGSPLGIRCAYLTNGAALTGFTLTTGGSRSSGDPLLEESGGGVWCESSSAVVSNCVVGGNVAAQYGGGIYQGTLLNCTVTNNRAQNGGGTFSNTACNCTLIANHAQQCGGAAYQGALNNCIITNNQAFLSGGGTYLANLNNCVVSSNKLIQGSGGGGAAFGILGNCLVTGNFAPGYGGGTYFSTLNNCVVSNNSAGFGGGVCYGVINNSLISSNSTRATGLYGGGAYSNILNNCVLKNNFANGSGGGAYNSILNNCTVVSNTASIAGGGIYGGALTNCIVYDNIGVNLANTKNFFYTCTTPIFGNAGCFTNAPVFVDEAIGDYHLQSNSPCINSGNNASAPGGTDLDGNPRIVGGTVDIGAYEFQSPSSVLSYAWAQQYALPTDGTADYLDSDGDHMNNWQEWKAGTIPTNAASVLQLSSPSNSVSGTTITWQSVSGVTYYLQRSTNLSAQPVFTTIQSNIVGQTGTTSYLDTTAAGHDLSIYRVGVQ